MTQRIIGAVQTAVLSMVLVFLWPAGRLHSQELAGVIAGQVADETDKILPGARVVVTDRQSGRITTVVTDGSGSYRIEITPGVYAVRFEVSGFARQEVAPIEVHLGRTVRLSATLRVGNVTETVEVTSENALLVDTRTATVGQQRHSRRNQPAAKDPHLPIDRADGAVRQSRRYRRRNPGERRQRRRKRIYG